MNDPVNFGELLWRSTRLSPDAIALVQDDVEVTYRELEVRVRRVSALVRSLGVRPGEPVLLLLPNDWRFIECLLGVMRAGAVATPLNVKLGDETLRYIAGHSEARIPIPHGSLDEQAAALGVERTFYPDAECYMLTDADRGLVWGRRPARWACLLPMLFVRGSSCDHARVDG